MNIEAVRMEARLATYPNQHAEAENIKRIDDAIFDKVRLHESQLVAQAQQFQADHDLDVKAADLIETALRREIRFALEEGQPLTDARAARYAELRDNALLAIADLDRGTRDADFHIARCSDPLASYQKILTTWPQLAPKISVR